MFVYSINCLDVRYTYFIKYFPKKKLVAENLVEVEEMRDSYGLIYEKQIRMFIRLTLKI